MPLVPSHWTTLVDTIRSGGIQLLQFFAADFSALDDNALQAAIGWRGLKLLVVQRCVVPSRLITDDLLRTSAAQGVRRLRIRENKSDTLHRLSDDAVMDYFFLETEPAGGQSPHLVFEGSGLTDMFLAKVFERLVSSSSRPYGKLKFRGLRLRIYAWYLAPDQADATYRFPSTDGDDDHESYYEVKLHESSSHMSLYFYQT